MFSCYSIERDINKKIEALTDDKIGVDNVKEKGDSLNMDLRSRYVEHETAVERSTDGLNSSPPGGHKDTGLKRSISEYKG